MIDFVRANESDIDELTRMRIAYIKDDHGSLSVKDENIMLKNLPRYFKRHLENDLFAFVAKSGDEIISTALLLVIGKPFNPHFIHGMVGEVLSVYTMPQYRRKGISTRLMKNLLDFSKACGLDFVELKATEDGYSLYHKLGFQEYHSGYTAMRFEL